MVAIRWYLIPLALLLAACQPSTTDRPITNDQTTSTTSDSSPSSLYSPTMLDTSQSSTPSFAGSLPRLRYTIDPSIQRSFRITATSSTESDQGSLQEQKTIYYTVHGLASSDTIFQFRATIDSFQIRMIMQSQQEDLNDTVIISSMDTIARHNPQLQPYFLTIGHPVTIVVNHHGAILQVHGLTALIDSIVDAQLVSPSIDQQQRAELIQLLTTQLSQEFYISPLQNLFTYYPADTAELPTMWERRYTVPIFDPLIAKNVVSFRLAKWDSTTQQARIEMRMQATLSPLQFSDSTSTTTISPDYRYQGEGITIVDLRSGLPKYKTYHLSVELPITITNESQPPLTLTQRYTAEVELEQLP